MTRPGARRSPGGTGAMTRPGARRSPGGAGTAALQRALAAENAAIFGYGVAGAYLSGAQRAAATTFWDEHRAARDRLAAMLLERSAQPGAADDAYKLPFPVRTAAAATSLAAVLEDDVTAAYLALVAADDAGLRRFGALAMQGSAVRAAFWRGSTTAFPGFAPAGPPARPRR